MIAFLPLPLVVEGLVPQVPAAAIGENTEAPSEAFTELLSLFLPEADGAPPEVRDEAAPHDDPDEPQPDVVTLSFPNVVLPPPPPPPPIEAIALPALNAPAIEEGAKTEARAEAPVDLSVAGSRPAPEPRPDRPAEGRPELGESPEPQPQPQPRPQPQPQPALPAPAADVLPTDPEAPAPVMPARQNTEPPLPEFTAIPPGPDPAEPAPVPQAREGEPQGRPAPARERAELAFALRLQETPAARPEQSAAAPQARHTQPEQANVPPPPKDAGPEFVRPAVQHRIEAEPVADARPRPHFAPEEPAERKLPRPKPAGVQARFEPLAASVRGHFEAPALKPPAARPEMPVAAAAAIEPRAPEAPRQTAVREISMVLAPEAAPDRRSQRVELRLVESAGQIRVAVRASEPNLSQSLRQELGSLVSRLEQSGFQTDAWHPAATQATAEAASQVTRPGDQPSQHDSTNSGNRQHAGSQGGEQRQQRRDQDQGPRPQWLDALEHSLPSQAGIRSIFDDRVSH